MCSRSTPYSNDFPFHLHIKLPIGYREILFLKYYNDFFKAIGGCRVVGWGLWAEEEGNFNESGKSEMPYNRTKYLRLNHAIGVL